MSDKWLIFMLSTLLLETDKSFGNNSTHVRVKRQREPADECSHEDGYGIAYVEDGTSFYDQCNRCNCRCSGDRCIAPCTKKSCRNDSNGKCCLGKICVGKEKKIISKRQAYTCECNDRSCKFDDGREIILLPGQDRIRLCKTEEIGIYHFYVAEGKIYNNGCKRCKCKCKGSECRGKCTNRNCDRNKKKKCCSQDFCVNEGARVKFEDKNARDPSTREFKCHCPRDPYQCYFRATQELQIDSYAYDEYSIFVDDFFYEDDGEIFEDGEDYEEEDYDDDEDDDEKDDEDYEEEDKEDDDDDEDEDDDDKYESNEKY